MSRSQSAYFAEDDDFNFEVIDGLQRITSLKRFLSNEFPLTGVSVLKEIAGKSFRELAPRDQRRLESRTIRCVAITADSNPDIKFDVFERLNTNVAVLTAQELRNCIYRGPFNNSLKDIARNEALRTMVGASGLRRMVAEELVLRFLALNDRLADYRPPIRQFLNTYMRERRHESVTTDERDHIESSLEVALSVFGPEAFRLSDVSGRPVSAVNKALFDAIMLSVASLDHDELRLNVGTVKDVIPEVLQKTEFRQAIGRATADRKRVYARVRVFGLSLEERGLSPRTLEIVGRQESR
jgi:hypothetical protein